MKQRVKRSLNPRATCAPGFTLVEVAVVLAVVALLAGMAVPSTLAYLQKSRRSDAAASLTRLQFAQERHHELFGLYAADVHALAGARNPVSDGGLYHIHLVEAMGDRYGAVALARRDGAQAADSACAQITLVVVSGVAEYGPTPACWNR